MAKYVINKDNSTTAIKAKAKADVLDIITKALVAEFGEENVGMVRTGSSTQTNELGFIVGTVEKEGYEYDLVFTVNPTCKEFEGRKTAKKVYEAFDFEEARQEYELYLKDKATRKLLAEQKKAERIANGKVSKSKKEKEEALAARQAELDEAAARAKEKAKARLEAQLAAAKEKREQREKENTAE